METKGFAADMSLLPESFDELSARGECAKNCPEYMSRQNGLCRLLNRNFVAAGHNSKFLKSDEKVKQCLKTFGNKHIEQASNKV